MGISGQPEGFGHKQDVGGQCWDHPAFPPFGWILFKDYTWARWVLRDGGGPCQSCKATLAGLAFNCSFPLVGNLQVFCVFIC